MKGTIHLPKEKRMATIPVDLVYKKGGSSVDVMLNAGDDIAAKFTTPATVKNGGAGGQISVAEYGSPSAQRVLCINTTPGNFSPNSVPSKHGPVATNYVEDTYPVKAFGPKPMDFELLPSTTYYVNIKNVQPVNGMIRISLTV